MANVDHSVGSQVDAQATGVGDGPTAVYIGALDESKGLRLLFDAGAEIAETIPAFRIVICGDGPLRKEVEDRASRTTWLRYAGRVTGREKVAVAACARLMIVPARIGLVAVDSLALALPLVTTTESGHGPEYEFLEPGKTVVVAPGGARELAAAVVELLRDEERLSAMSAHCVKAAELRTVGEMVRLFTAGVQEAVAAAR